jgi:hypothetical protein
MPLLCKFGDSCKQEVGGKFIYAKNSDCVGFVAAVTVCQLNLCNVRTQITTTGGYSFSPFTSGFDKFQQQELCVE